MAPRARGAKQDRRGYSVAELVTVLVISGVVLSLTVPRFAAIRDSSATRSASADLGALFATARHLAITRRDPVTVLLDGRRGAAEVRVRGQVLVRHEFGTMYGVTLGATRDSSVFDARGLGYGAANLTVVFRRGRASDTVVVSRLGRVRTVW